MFYSFHASVFVFLCAGAIVLLLCSSISNSDSGMASMPRAKELQVLVDLQKSPSTHLKANLCSKQLKYIPGHVGVLRNLDTLLLRKNCLDALPEEIADLPIVSIYSIAEGQMNQSLLELHTFWCFSGRSSMKAH